MNDQRRLTGVEIMALLNQGKIPSRVPFVPVVYEHAASLLGITPSVLAYDENLIVEGTVKAFSLYQPDLVSVGVDIYNVEAEALGCQVACFDDYTIPSISKPLFYNRKEFIKLKVPDPTVAGRIPMMISATKQIKGLIGGEVPVSGTVVGPFTLAAILRGFEPFLEDMIMDEPFAREQLNFALEVAYSYATGFIDIGVGVAINESWIAPPLLSPQLFGAMVLEYEATLIKRLKVNGLKNVALICGGDTTPIAEMLVRTGTSLLMADANSDQGYIKKLCDENAINLRASIPSGLVQDGNPAKLEEAVKLLFNKCAANGRFIFGCGIVSAITPPENVLRLKSLVERFNPY